MKQQEKASLCWAAGIQMIFANEGVSMTQLDIARRVFDIQFFEDDLEYHLNGHGIEKLLKDLKFEINGTSCPLVVNAYADLHVYDRIILNELERHRPILTSYNKMSTSIADVSYGHVVVISGVNYSVSSDVKTINELFVIDPENNTDSLVMTYKENELQYFLSAINALWVIDLVNPTCEIVAEQQKNNPKAF